MRWIPESSYEQEGIPRSGKENGTKKQERSVRVYIPRHRLAISTGPAGHRYAAV
jgi:hypothetical protein